MCGIAGYIDFNRRDDRGVLNQMVMSLKHRGPDNFGTAININDYATVGLAQARLSIIDMSDDGNQPYFYKDLVLVFNGEIYNYQEIKAELTSLGHEFISKSDTEVVIHALDEWGEAAVEKFIGMFAYVLYDKKEYKISITRDRAGIKPLYYYYSNGVFLFGSELKALMEHPKFERQVDTGVLPLYFQYGYIPSPYSIFKDCYKLRPGHHLLLDLKTGQSETKKYWDVLDFYKKPKLNISYEEAKENVHELLKSACNYRMIADVPVGVFLSGGYDSTAVTAILQKDRPEKLKTFTIGFEGSNNEAPFAQETAEILGTDHTEYYCTVDDAKNIIPTLPFYYDEPFADSSAIPTMLVSSLAKKQVTVALSSDAGDEVFCGYTSYTVLHKSLQKVNLFPKLFHKPIRYTAKGLSIFHNFIPVQHSQKIKGLTQTLSADANLQSAQLFQVMNELPNHYIQSLFKNKTLSYISPFKINTGSFNNPIEIAMAIDYTSYLQNDILTKVDRATMSVSLEGREPLLDHRLIEYVAQLPFEFKSDGGKDMKKILKDIVHEYMPKQKMERPKSGFSLPIYKWLQKDLSYLLDEYLNRESINWSGLLNESSVLKIVQDFKENKLHYKPLLWRLLMFQMWYKQWMIQTSEAMLQEQSTNEELLTVN